MYFVLHTCTRNSRCLSFPPLMSYCSEGSEAGVQNDYITQILCSEFILSSVWEVQGARIICPVCVYSGIQAIT